jgi:hypothetical protein
MNKDYIPTKDGELIVFAENFQNKTSADLAKYGLTEAGSKELELLIAKFDTEVSDDNVKQSAADASSKQKNATKKLLRTSLRKKSQTIQKLDDTSDSDRAALNLTVAGKTRTAAGVPTSRPVAQVDTSQPLRHTIKFSDNVGEGKAKPAGVMGAEVWVKIGGEATMNEDDYKYLSVDTATPYLAIHKAEDVGKKAHYLLRWINTRGEKGAWSDVVSAVITG